MSTSSESLRQKDGHRSRGAERSAIEWGCRAGDQSPLRVQAGLWATGLHRRALVFPRRTWTFEASTQRQTHAPNHPPSPSLPTGPNRTPLVTFTVLHQRTTHTSAHHTSDHGDGPGQRSQEQRAREQNSCAFTHQGSWTVQRWSRNALGWWLHWPSRSARGTCTAARTL